MAETYSQIKFERVEPQIARLTLARPKQMNAYTTLLCEEMVAAIETYLRDDALRVLIITGEGRGFCAGGDVSGADDAHDALMKSQLSHAREMRDGMHRVIQALHRVDKPVIAMINGPAVAGGLALALWAQTRLVAQGPKKPPPPASAAAMALTKRRRSGSVCGAGGVSSSVMGCLL